MRWIIGIAVTVILTVGGGATGIMWRGYSAMADRLIAVSEQGTVREKEWADKFATVSTQLARIEERLSALQRSESGHLGGGY